MATAPPVGLVEERRFDPPRAVEVEHNGRWWPGTQYAWRLCRDHRGWMAEVRWTEQHERGLRTYVPMVPPERGAAAVSPRCLTERTP
jgi:hypothetical protein